MNAQHIKISKLKGNPSNPRVLRDEKFIKLKNSIEAFPDMLQKRPIVAVTDKDGKYMVLGGNMRLKACADLGMKEVPVILADEWTEEQRREFIIKDNVGFGEWDWDQLANEWDAEQLADWGMDLPADFAAETNEGLTDPDEVPSVPVDPVTVLGDVWLLGKHRIVCGDSTHADTVAKCLNGVKPHLMVTDPPYGVSYDADWRSEAGVATLGKTRTGKVHNDDRADWREVWALFPGDVCYIWSAPGPLQVSSFESIEAAGFDVRQQIIWVKERFALGRGHYHYQHEPCWYAVRGTGHWTGDRKQTSVWNIASPLHIMGTSDEKKTSHPTQKPVECMKRPIENNSSPGQAVYEPFSGSGTTIIAGEMTGRSIHAIELSPEYVDVAVKRWQDFTGQEAIHEATGRTFNDMLAEKGNSVETA
jgi:DNA modification methylase